MPLLGKRLVENPDGTLTEMDEWVELTPEARKQSLYLLGTTGVGKTTLLKSLIVQDIVAGEGVCAIDPHGDLADELLTLIPQNRKDDVLLFAPGDPDQRTRPLGLNLFACDRSDEQQVQQVTSTVINTLHRLFAYSWGPRMEDLLRISILTLMATPQSTFLDLSLLLTDPLHRRKYVQMVNDYYLKQFWEVQFYAYTRSPRDLIELIGSSLNKIGRFLADPRIRRIISQPTTAFSLRKIMDNRKIMLVNLSKGSLGEDNSALLGSVLVNLILMAALTRRDTPAKKRVPFHLYVDEYQSFANSDTFSVLQSEVRKYGIDTVVAHQFRDQLDDLNRGSTLNVANFVVMRVSGIDSHELATQFDNTPPEPDTVWESQRLPYVDPAMNGFYWPDNTVQYPRPGIRRSYSDVAAEQANRLTNLPNYQAHARLVVDGRLQECIVKVVPPEGLPLAKMPEPDETVAAYIRQESLKRGVPAEIIDAMIRDKIGEQPGFDPYPQKTRDITEETDE
ncbi:MAG: type IV secretion system DNA-binding domain-containing protein [Anaerolineae bacterium]|nr:type IV secretion system DNA-binding domain-containing protein [Anaerolineae bacterium]